MEGQRACVDVLISAMEGKGIRLGRSAVFDLPHSRFKPKVRASDVLIGQRLDGGAGELLFGAGRSHRDG